MSETMEGTLYWQEVREGLFVHNKDWNKTISRLPDLLSAKHTLSTLQTVNQLVSSGLKGRGTIGHQIVEVKPNPDVMIEQGFLYLDTAFPVENLFLQWVYKFTLVEAISSNFHNTPLPQWPPMFLGILEENLHSMTYLATLILLYEECQLKDLVTSDNFQYSEIMVRNRVAELTSTLYAKCAEYGESFRRHGIQGSLPRLWDKVARYAQLSALGCSATYEPKHDSAKDLLGYCLIAWSLIHEMDNLDEELL